ncbi:beta-galactosidase [Hufsiella ginkgonis]|uniref:Beta-galactosidase n=1 Tax=Hufsiella ginkgonis TaxID=2695274 RepID=A0A7K1XZW1_9SPHI|nr:beta-galactosidase [Hufsiella ginkgonis]MXV16357.1 hypothetical protein [Hufsiella ginkgonis]
MKLIVPVKNSLVLLLLAFFLRSYAQQTMPVARNDHIFPASAAAKPFIDYDSRGFLVNGKRMFVVSAGMEYARVPHELWEDRLVKLKRAGFNTVEMYTFWNFHEPKEGWFDFSGDQDLDAYLRLIKKLGMYAIVRVGPYYCGEWNFGGYPVWLKFKPGLRVREDNPQFLAAVGKFFDKLIPIVSANQVHKGGAVIMVQLENEHPESWGNIVPNGYFKYLADKTVSLGLEVPYFFSGLHPGNDPAGNLKSLDDAKRPNPWFSTEYWGVWFFNYGAQPQDSTIYDRRTWKIIAHGGNGYNVYMAHGGSNFGYNNDRDMAASYDYGAAIGQTGDLRPIYYGFKRAAWFARSFQEILANSKDGGNSYRWMVRDTSIKINARISPAGNIAFADNPKARAALVRIVPPKTLKPALPVTVRLAPGEIMPVVNQFQAAPGISLEWNASRIFGIVTRDKTTTMITYGDPGSTASLYFKITGAAGPITVTKNFKQLGSGIIAFSAPVAAPAPASYVLAAGDRQLQVLVLSKAHAQRCWIVEDETGRGNSDIVVGSSVVTYAGYRPAKRAYGPGAAGPDQQVIVTEVPLGKKLKSPAWIFKPGALKLNPVEAVGDTPVGLPVLSSWEMKSASVPALVTFDDKNWKQSKPPLQMGADGDITANAWYRTQLKVAETGDYILRFKNIRERASVFLNGTRIDSGEMENKAVQMRLESGKTNTLSVFASHNGRNKLLFYRGVLDTIDAKGISGEVTLTKAVKGASSVAVENWKMKGGAGTDTLGGWSPFKLVADRGPVFYRSAFNLAASPGYGTTWRVITTSLGHGSVWVNGHHLGRYPEKIKINGLYIPEPWLREGRNEIVIFDEDGTSPLKVSIRAETAAGRETVIFTM